MIIQLQMHFPLKYNKCHTISCPTRFDRSRVGHPQRKIQVIETHGFHLTIITLMTHFCVHYPLMQVSVTLNL
jgi:hypothetical protein